MSNLIDFQLRIINYTSTDEDGNKIYTGHKLQTLEGRSYSWFDVPVIEQHVEPEEARLMITGPPAAPTEKETCERCHLPNPSSNPFCFCHTATI
jgi:hypothetical protein